MRTLALALMLVVLAACGSATVAPDTTGGAASSAAASTPPMSSGLPLASEAAASPEASPSGKLTTGSDGAAPGLEARASAALAAQLNTSAEQLQLVTKEQMEWNDGALGCPAPGMMYTQALVPGYKLVYSDGTREYELHTDETGAQTVWCENGQPKEMPQP